MATAGIKVISPGTTLKRHPLSAEFPVMHGPEFDELKKSIKERGVQVPIILYKGEVFDGWNRYTAAQQVGAEVPAQECELEYESLIALAGDLNIHRRSLSKSQCAMIGARLAAEYATLLKNKRKAANHPEQAKDDKADKDEKADEAAQHGRSRSRAAKDAGVSEAYIHQAGEIEQKDPELAARVRSGEISIPEARRLLKQEEKEANTTVTDGQGNPVTDDDLKNVFFEVPEIRAVTTALTKAFGELKALAQSTTGAASRIDLEAVRTAISTARGYILSGMPYIATPAECNVSGAKKRGWITKEEFVEWSNSADTGEKKMPAKKKTAKKPAKAQK